MPPKASTAIGPCLVIKTGVPVAVVISQIDFSDPSIRFSSVCEDRRSARAATISHQKKQPPKAQFWHSGFLSLAKPWPACRKPARAGRPRPNSLELFILIKAAHENGYSQIGACGSDL
jgi:hypothetical protein